jgi:hypothetical protein
VLGRRCRDSTLILVIMLPAYQQLFSAVCAAAARSLCCLPRHTSHSCQARLNVKENWSPMAKYQHPPACFITSLHGVLPDSKSHVRVEAGHTDGNKCRSVANVWFYVTLHCKCSNRPDAEPSIPQQTNDHAHQSTSNAKPTSGAQHRQGGRCCDAGGPGKHAPWLYRTTVRRFVSQDSYHLTS